MRLYGKDLLKRRLDMLADKGRLSHAILLQGQRGSGRKVTARYIAAQHLCENKQGGEPCGVCAVCRNVFADTHPDVIFVKRACGGKYKMEEFREVLKSTVIKPNNASLKVYIFEESDEMMAQHLNALLKLIEEPAAYLRFVFTAENAAVLPETILSRAAMFEVPDTSVAECERCLADNGLDKSEAKRLSEVFFGNIGKCRAALDGGEGLEQCECSKKAAAAAARGDRYGFAAALSEQSDRAAFMETLELFGRILRDALAISCGCEGDSHGKKEAAAIAASHTSAEIIAMLDVLFGVIEDAKYNLNLALMGARLAASIIGG